MARHDTMLRPGGIELSRIAVRLKAAGRRALDERRA
jgi:hypothetical protein